jgi:hypothetical protein
MSDKTLGDKLLEGLGLSIITTGVIATGAVAIPTDMTEKIPEGAEYISINVRRLTNDWTSAPWSKLPPEERHPAIALLVGEINEENKRIKEIDGGRWSDKYYERIDNALGQMSRKANQADITLAAMLMSAHKHGEPTDRSNADIKMVLGKFVDDIDIIMRGQEFPVRERFDRNMNNMACFSPAVVADNFLKVTDDKVKAELRKKKEFENDPDLGTSDIKQPALFSNKCYKYAPFEFSKWWGDKPLFGTGK